ncbi:MAG: hypothetical protein V1745_02145 [Patescibacteria group bacterium]
MSPKFEGNAARKIELAPEAPTLHRVVPAERPSSPIPLEKKRKAADAETEAEVIQIRKKLTKRSVPTIPSDEVPHDDIDVDLSELESEADAGVDVDLSDIDAEIAADAKARRKYQEIAEPRMMTIEKARELVPNASHLWEHANRVIQKDPEANLLLGDASRGFFMPESKTPGSAAPDAATAYVFTLAKYREAQLRHDEEEAKELEKKVVEMSEALGLLKKKPSSSGPEPNVAKFSKPPQEALEETERFLEQQVSRTQAYEFVPAHDQFVALVRDRTEGHPRLATHLAEEALRYRPRPDPSEALTFAVANVLALRKRNDIDGAKKEEARVRALASTLGVSGNPLFESSLAQRTYADGMKGVRSRQADVKRQTKRWNLNIAA